MNTIDFISQGVLWSLGSLCLQQLTGVSILSALKISAVALPVMAGLYHPASQLKCKHKWIELTIQVPSLYISWAVGAASAVGFGLSPSILTAYIASLIGAATFLSAGHFIYAMDNIFRGANHTSFP